MRKIIEKEITIYSKTSMLDDRHPELYKLFDKSDVKRLDTLKRLIEENKNLKEKLDDRKAMLDDYSLFMMSELIPLRLAIREIEKDSWISKQIKNTELENEGTILHKRIVPTSLAQSKMHIESEKLQKNYMDELSIKRAERTQRALKQRKDELKSKEE